MKKPVAVVLSLVMLFTAASALADAYRIAIVQPLSHTSLNQIRDTIIDRLNAASLDIEIVTDNANGDGSALPAILNNLRGDGIDMLVPIATNTAQAAKVVFEDDEMPIVFAAVADRTCRLWSALARPSTRLPSRATPCWWRPTAPITLASKRPRISGAADIQCVYPPRPVFIQA